MVNAPKVMLYMRAKINTTNNTKKSYIGMTGRMFIDRWKEHRGNLRHKHQKGTKLSNYVWKQKEFGINIKFEDIWPLSQVRNLLRNNVAFYWLYEVKYKEFCW